MDVDDGHLSRLEEDTDLPRHQRRRPTMLSMDLVDTPSSEPMPVVGSMSNDTNSDTSSSGVRVSTSPMGKIRMVSEKLGSSVYSKKKRDKDKKKRSSNLPSSSSSSSSSSALTVVGSLTPTRSSPASVNVRISSPLSREVGSKPTNSSSSSSCSCGNTKNSSNNNDTNHENNHRGRNMIGTPGGSSLKKRHSSPLDEVDLHDLALDQSKYETGDHMQGGHYHTDRSDDHDEERKEEACDSPRVGSSNTRGGGMFRPLSPLVMPILRSPRVVRILGVDNADKVAALFEGKNSPATQQQQQQEQEQQEQEQEQQQEQQQQQQQQQRSPSSSSFSSSGSTISSLAKTMAHASVHAMSSSTSSFTSSSSSTPVIAPKPVRADAPVVLLPLPPPPSSFSHVQPYLLASEAPATAAAATAAATTAVSSTQHKTQPRHSSSISVSVPPPSVLQQNFTVALGLCLLACGLSQAGLEWYTMKLGSDESRWWAGLICALLGLATMAAQKKRGGGNNINSSSSSANSSSGTVMRSLQESVTLLVHLSYAFLVMGGAAAVVAALFFDLKFLDRLEQTNMCGASTEKLVMDNGLVLSETLGNACGFSSACACVQFTHLSPTGNVACMDFGRSSAAACPHVAFAMAGMVRVSVWLMGGLLFFIIVLMLRARASVIAACTDQDRSRSVSRRRSSGSMVWRREEEEGPVVSSFGSNKVRALSVESQNRLKVQDMQQWEASKGQFKSWWQPGDEDSSSDDDEEEEGGGKGIAGLTMALEGQSGSRGGGARNLVLTPIPECNTPQPEEEMDGSSRDGRLRQGNKAENHGSDDYDDDDDEQVAPPRGRQDVVYI